MKKNKKDKSSQSSDNKTFQPLPGKDGENQQNKPFALLPVKTEKNLPVKADLDNRRSIQNRPHQH
jgi:hypothetical protein